MAVSNTKVMKPFEWGLLALLSILWGGSFFFAKVAGAELRPFSLVLGRVAIASVVLNVIVVATGHRLPSSVGAWAPYLVMGTLNNVIPFSLIFWGQTQIASGLASVLNAAAPLWSVLLAHFWTREERLTSHRLTGVLMGLAGVATVMGPDALRGLGLNVLAQAAVLGATVCYAFAGIYGRRFSDTSPVVTAAAQVTCTVLMMTPVVVLVDRPWLSAPTRAVTWAALLGLGLLSTAVAYVVYFRVLATAGPTNLLLVTLLIPVSALLLGAMVLGEQLGARHLMGMALVGLGLIALDGRVLSLSRAKRR